MDMEFCRMIEEAEKVRKKFRGTGTPGTHGRNMAEIIRYCQAKKLFKEDANPLDDDATEEQLALGAEMAAMMLQMNLNEEIGSVLSLSVQERKNLMKRV